MHTSSLIRPAWTPATIALTVAGFMVFWPVGLAMLGYVLFGERLNGFKQDANSAVDGVFSSCRRAAGGFGRNAYSAQSGYTGNVAFDEWRTAEIERLNDERRKLDEMRSEFEADLRELRRAKDKQEFDSFMARREAGKTASRPSVPEVKGE